jgi:anti-sigma-K factor RskA
MSEQLIPEQLTAKQLASQKNMPKRYANKEVVEHLASQYVLGTLTEKTHLRIEGMLSYNPILAERIDYWQNRFVSLDQQTPALPPSEVSWQNIADKLDMPVEQTVQDKQVVPENVNNTHNQAEKLLSGFINRLMNSFHGWLTPNYRLASGFSVLAFALFALFFNPLADKSDPLSYVAVLTEQSGQAHLVASTYGDSKKLVVNVINSPKITEQESLELWVISKTDAQARSLGLIPLDKPLIEQQLTTAQWRLIKDSDSLIVTIEEAGGSAIGEPSEQIVSRGLCIRLQEWQKNA